MLKTSLLQPTIKYDKLTYLHKHLKSNLIALTHILWQVLPSVMLLTLGSVITAIGYALFQVPYRIAAGGITGIGILINYYTGWSEGTMFLLMNIPLLILGYFYLDRWHFLMGTAYGVAVFSFTTDLILAYQVDFLPTYPITDDMLLSAIYAGLVIGIGTGLVYRGAGTLGGTSILGRIIKRKTGIPLSQIYLYTDGGIIVAAGIIFGWEAALYAMLTLYLSGLVTDYTLEGPSNIRTVTIITDSSQAVCDALIQNLGQGLSRWEIKGGYNQANHTMILCTVSQPQVDILKRIIAKEDPHAFVVIGVAHQALGQGFKRL